MNEKEKALERLQILLKAWDYLKAHELPDEYQSLLREFERLAAIEIKIIGGKNVRTTVPEAATDRS